MSPRCELLLPVRGVQAFDNACTRTLGLPIELLMEHAGILVAQQARAMLRARRTRRTAASAYSVIVLAGPGNNGGDGAVAARLLSVAGERVLLCRIAPASACSPLCRQQLRRAKLAGVAVQPWSRCKQELLASPLVIDAMFGAGFGAGLGAGLRRPLQGNALAACKLLAQSREHEPKAARGNSSPRVLAVDVPSGMQGDTGEALGGICIHADVTLCLTARKPCTLVPHAKPFCGRVVVAPLPVAPQERYDCMLQAAGALTVPAWEKLAGASQQVPPPAETSRRSRSKAR